MKKSEQHLADELERYLSAELTGQPTDPAADLPESEARLAAKLVDLANDTEPDPEFVAKLGAKLAVRAHQKKRKKRPERLTFWQQFTQLIKEGLTMKRTAYALGGVLALAIVFVAAYLWWNRAPQNEDAASVADVTTEETDTAADSIDITEEGGEDGDDVVAELAELPLLPRMEGAQPRSQGGGGGPGLGAAVPEAEDAAAALPVEPFVYTSPLSGTSFILNTGLPVEPTSGLVQQRPPLDEVELATAQQLAGQFGFTGPLYIESFPEIETIGIEESTIDVAPVPFEPPTTYHVFDGLRQMAITPWGVFYNDNNVPFDYENPLSFAQAKDIAEAFLQERNLLDFEYTVQEGFSGEVFFVRLIDGRPIDQPEIIVGVNSDGAISFVNHQVWSGLELLGPYPLISAEAAWQRILDGVDANNIMFMIRPSDTFEEPVIIEDPLSDRFQFWERSYAPGDEVHLYEWPLVYLPAEGAGAPRVQMRNYVLQADEATLNGLAENTGRQIHLWGQIAADGTTIELAGWEPWPENSQPISQQGVIRYEIDQVLFAGEDGRTFIIPDAPADLPDGLEVFIFAWAARDVGAAYQVIDWDNINKVVDFPEEEFVGEPEPLIDETFEPFRYEEVTVNSVELAYASTYIFPEEDERTGFDQSTLILQPTWKFTGTADNGDIIDLFVQAVDEAYLAGE